jgi:glycine oxidase
MQSMSHTQALEGRDITVIGAGVAGLTASLALAERGANIRLYERSPALGTEACSRMAGGMLAPFCERDGTDAVVSERGQRALHWWPRHIPGLTRGGSLVVAAPRDHAELTRFASGTQGHKRLDGDGVAGLEADLAGRFERGLWFPDEAHLDPRKALGSLATALQQMGGAIEFGAAVCPSDFGTDHVVDCRGLGARDALPSLRGVRGEMVLLQSRDIHLERPVRLLHPRTPVYVVPREGGLFMVGATSIESEFAGPPSVRSTMELLNAAYALHPAFGDAHIVELGVGLRPAFPDNLPRLVEKGSVVHFNGLYRHGFLLAPWYAEKLGEGFAERFSEAA